VNSPEVSAQLGSDRTGQFLRVPLSCRQSSEDQRRGSEVHAATTGCATCDSMSTRTIRPVVHRYRPTHGNSALWFTAVTPVVRTLHGSCHKIDRQNTRGHSRTSVAVAPKKSSHDARMRIGSVICIQINLRI